MNKFKILTIELGACEGDDIIIDIKGADEDTLWEVARKTAHIFVDTCMRECEDVAIEYVGNGRTMYKIKTIDSEYAIVWID